MEAEEFEKGAADESAAPDSVEPETAEPELEQEGLAEPEQPGEAQEPEQPELVPEPATDKAGDYLLLAQRTQADFENYRKRAVREAALAQDRGIAKLAKELLPALDHLELALKAAGAEDSQIAEGIRLVQTDLLSALQRVGVEPFSPAGEPFDPQFHEAVAQAPIEGAESGTVADVFQQGYRMGDSVLRPARVLVAA